LSLVSHEDTIMISRRHLCFHLLILLIVAVMPGGLPAAAQDPDEPAAEIEALALHVHRLNLRTTDFTVWTGGDMGNSVQFKPGWTPGDPFTGWQLPGQRSSDAAVAWDDLTRPTLLNVWASWCPPCIQEFPHMTDIALNPADHAFDVLFVNTWDDETAALEFLSDYPPDIHALSDPEATVIMTPIESVGIPTSILVMPDGTVLAIHVGTFTHAHAALFEMIAQHPGVGSFDAANYPDVEPLAVIDPVDPASATPIAYQRSVSGTLTDEDFQHAYALNGKAGQVITAQMSAVFHFGPSGRPDPYVEPYLVLLAEDGTRLAESRDYFYENVASIESFTLPEDGVYVIVATRFLEADGLSAGKYELMVDVE
jgi:thiol-disulfide isomerase/thioredoxin